MRPRARLLSATALLIAGAFSATAHAATAIEVWHSLSGPAALEINRMAQDFNASQDEYVVMPLYRGNERETVEAGLAAQRKGHGPAVLQVDDSMGGVASAAPRSFLPLYQVMERAKQNLPAGDFLPMVRDSAQDLSLIHI